MSFFVITAFAPSGRAVSQESRDTVDAAREAARVIVDERKEAFGDDREALESYGFNAAEDQALAMSHEGGTIFLQDGWRIEVAYVDNADHG
jgi:hypothetical protein